MDCIVVTGGCGFIGGAFVRLFHQKYRIVVVDAMTYAADVRNIIECTGVEIKNVDIANKTEMGKVIKEYRPRFIVNFAAESHVDRSIANADRFIYSNIIGAKVLFELAVKHRVQRVVQISTDEVYGQIIVDPFTEKSPVNPRNPYSASKASAEMYANAYRETFGLDVVITRGSNTYGPCQFEEKLIPVALSKLLNGGKVPIYGKGLQMREWLYVDDHAKAVEYVLLHGTAGEVYNINGLMELRNIDLVRLLIAELGLNEDRIEFVPDRLGHDFRYCMNGQKLAHLGWKHEIDFALGMNKTIRYYRRKWRKHESEQDRR